MSAVFVFWSLTLISLGGCAFAYWKGGTAERLAASVIVANIVLGILVGGLAPKMIEAFRLVNDGLAAAALLILAVRYAAAWLGVAMLLYAAQFGLHAYFLVLGLPEAMPLHAHLNNAIFVSIIASLVIGTAMTWRRRVREQTAASISMDGAQPAP